jgi:hypothetical protein
MRGAPGSMLSLLFADATYSTSAILSIFAGTGKTLVSQRIIRNTKRCGWQMQMSLNARERLVLIDLPIRGSLDGY